ncbi:MAG: hypothetical protein DMD80_12360 [Candidatus Rokuibacteriota bacterium]|nr:MAG: hypothetical protein DMD80_12360 [Candidatus Rokubacteria bacterium]
MRRGGVMLRRGAYAALAVLILGCLLSGVRPGSVTTTPRAHAQAPTELKYTGAASCAASNCHGSAKPKPDYPKLNENIVWAQKDQHAKAYATLTNEKLKSGVSPSKIARELKLTKAEASERCLTCHAVNVPAAARGPKFDITDGVFCDACHGPAEKWLEAHAEKGWTHEQSVKLGMYDTKNFLLRSEKCVSCHLSIDQELVAAGHPDLLAFELATFSANMPPHWRDKGTWADTKVWATGQAILLREAAKQLASRAKSGVSAKLLDDALRKVQGHAAVVKHVLAPEAAKALGQDVAALVDLVTKGDRAGVTAGASKIAAAMSQEAPRLAGRDWDQAGTQKLMQSLTGDADAIAAAGVRAAEQAAMALDRLYNIYSKAPGNKPDKAAGEALDRLFAAIENPAKYDAKQFAAEVKAFEKNLK